MLKEFRVCYTLDDEVKWGNIRKKSIIKKEDVLQEILIRIERCDFFIIKNDNNNIIITTSKVRYIRIHDENSYKSIK